MYNLTGIPVDDTKVLDLYGMERGLENTPEINFRILEDARQQELLDYGDDHELINLKYDRLIMNMKVKLASRGLLYKGKVNEDKTYDTSSEGCDQ